MVKDPLEKACDILGSQRALAAAVGVTPQAVTKWLERGIPAERVLEVEKATGISRHDLRPDLYPRDSAA